MSPLYLRLKKRISIPSQGAVKLQDVAHIWSETATFEEEAKTLILYRHKVTDGNRVVIDLLQIIRIIKQRWSDLQVEAYGDPQVLIMIQEQASKPKYVYLILCWLLLFFGSGLALMNFHADVNMKEVHMRIVEIITGEKKVNPLWFQIPYSMGVGAGMILFFNHIFRKKFNEEPNPLEVEMFMYQENVNSYVVAEEMRKKSEKQLSSIEAQNDH